MLNGVVAIIPARGGSKRIPKKNIIDFAGKPMIGWTIEAALESGLFDKIIVSTDDEEIAAVAQEWGVEVPFLRSSANDDMSPVSLATLAALEQAENYWKTEYETVVQLMPNCPLRGSNEIKQALENFNANESNFQISAVKYGWLNPWWAHTKETDGNFRRIFPEIIEQRSQDLPELLCPTGIIWIANSVSLKSERTFYGENYSLQSFGWDVSVDIDDFDDLIRAKHIKLEKE